MLFSTKNGIFVSAGFLEKNHLAVAFNMESFLFKLNKTEFNEIEDLISSQIHTVLAQIDQENHSGRMLNAGGLLVLTDEKSNAPLNMLMLKERNGLQLGFGKVELQDLDKQLKPLQNEIDVILKKILIDCLLKSNDKKEFIKALSSDSFKLMFQNIETLLNEEEHNRLIETVIASHANDTTSLQSSFNRPALNPLVTLALINGAKRELCEEMQFENEFSLNENQLVITQDINRENATQYVQSVLNTKEPQFSAKERNDDFESVTFIAGLSINEEQLHQLKTRNCLLIKPQHLSIEIKDKTKGILETTIAGYPPVLGGGNQYAIALACNTLFGIQVVEKSSQPQNTPFVFFQPADTSVANNEQQKSFQLT